MLEKLLTSISNMSITFTGGLAIFAILCVTFVTLVGTYYILRGVTNLCVQFAKKKRVSAPKEKS